MKLELKYLAPYLPYQLKVWDEKDKFPYLLLALEEDNCTLESGDLPFYWCKPILRPLSDLETEIEVKGKMLFPIEWIENEYVYLDLHTQCRRIIEDVKWINHCEYLLIMHLLEWHFDIFGLIEKGLAIDANTLEIAQERK